MIGAIHQKPTLAANQKIIPLERYGIKAMSMGFLVEEKSAVVWRGPMLFKAMDQFLRDVEWGELDYLLIDLPPGTGDVQLSLAQKVPLAGAVAITTPQNIALADVKKSIDMFQRVNVPILGFIENMAYYLHPATEERLGLFPKGDLENYLQENRFTKLGEIPFSTVLSQSAEIGIPILETQPKDILSLEFLKMAAALRERLPV
jgi:ATP-binding protein involved in chromosome partitioning